MNDDDGNHDLLDELADEFVTRKQAGQSPKISDYCLRYPALKSQIQELFPTLDLLENVKPQSDPGENGRPSHPEKIGEYRILRRIGRGGMGVVYEAEHESLGRRVALKVVAPRVSQDDRARARFQREARAVAKLHHTNIVPLFEVGEDGERLFLAMQMIRGESLDRVLAKIPEEEPDALESPGDPSPVGDKVVDAPRLETSVTENSDGSTVARSAGTGSGDRRRFHWIARIGLQAADALQFAHQRGIIHRDIKPSNLILDENDVVWLTDFGLAKTDDEELTQTGDILGTLRYMAPERFRGECTAQADVYSLGLTLFELGALQPAFSASDRLKLIDAIANSEPKKLRSIDSNFPRDLETVIHKAIDKDPSARYASAQELADDLNRFVTDQPILARRHSPVERLARWSRRNKGLAASLAGLAAMLVLVAIGSMWVGVREAGLRRLAVDAQHDAEDSQRTAEQRGDELRQTLYFAEMNLAGQAIDAPGGTRQILRLTSRWLPPPDHEDLRGWEWFYLRSLCRTEDLLLSTRQFGNVLEGSWSPAGDRVALAHDAGGVTVWNAVSGERLHHLPAGDTYSVAWSPTGATIAFGGKDGKLTLWDPQTGNELGSFVCESGPVLVIAWEGRGKQLAWGAGDTLYVASPGELQSPAVIHGGTYEVNTLQWSPDGSHIAGGNWWQNEFRVWDVASLKVVRDLPARFVKWSQDGHSIDQWLTSNDAGTIYIWDSASGQRVARLSGHRAGVRALAWDKSGSRLASASADQSVRVWDVESESSIRRFQGHSDKVNDVKWSPDDSRLMSSGYDQTARIWRPAGGVVSVLSAHADRVRSIRWTPNGTLLASAGRDGKVRIWASPGGAEVRSLEGHAQWVHAVCWSPDGTRLASCGDDGAIIWDVKTGKKLQFFPEAGAGMLEIDWSPNGQFLATIGGKVIRIWEASTGKLLRELDGHPPLGHTVRWSPQGDLLATAGIDQRIKIWETKTFQCREELIGHTHAVICISWRADGRHLASSCLDSTIKVWDVLKGTEVRTMAGHHGHVLSVQWSPDGSRIASSGLDGTVRVWDPDSGNQALVLNEATGATWSVGWSPDGRRLAAGDASGKIVVWDASRGYDRQAP